MHDASDLTLEELKVRGAAAILETRRMIASFHRIVAETRRTVNRDPDAFAINANCLARDLLE